MDNRGVVVVAATWIAAAGCEKPSERPVPTPTPTPVPADGALVDGTAGDAATPDAPLPDGPPPDARGKVARIACPTEPAELEAIARAAWASPADARIVVRCAAAAVPQAAWVLWGNVQSPGDNYEIRTTAIEPAGNHAVIAAAIEPTTDAMDVDGDFNTIGIEPLDLDADGIDELLRFHTHSELGVDATTLTIVAVRGDKLVDGTRIPYEFDDHAREGVDDPGSICTARHRLIGGPPPLLEITVKVVQGTDSGCADKGRHRFAWNGLALTLTEVP